MPYHLTLLWIKYLFKFCNLASETETLMIVSVSLKGVVVEEDLTQRSPQVNIYLFFSLWKYKLLNVY